MGLDFILTEKKKSVDLLETFLKKYQEIIVSCRLALAARS